MRTTAFILDHSPEAAAAVRYAARQASRTTNALRVVSPLSGTNGRTNPLEADPAGTREARRDHTQRWILHEAAPYLDQLTIRIEFPDLRLPTALTRALRGTDLLVTGSDLPVAETITSNDIAVVQVTATGRVDCVTGTVPGLPHQHNKGRRGTDHAQT